MALRFAAEGARVIVNGRRSVPIENVAASHEDVGGFAGDGAEPEVMRELVAHTVSSLGGLDVLFHAAGILRRNEVVTETTDLQWAADVSVNLTGAFNVVRAAIPALKASQGTVILVASQLAHIAAPGYATYCATKGGVLALARALAVDLGPAGVRVNALSPGIVESDMAYIGRDFAAIRDQVAATIPLRRVGEPEDMAGPAVFLASDDSRWMTGQALIVDGGFTAQ